jgi:PTS system nitrogen regulatory IIA component
MQGKAIAMNLADIISPEHVVCSARPNNKEQLLRDLASHAAGFLNLDPKMIFDALHAREQLGSTGLGKGFALPHASIEALDRFFGMFVRLKRPIDFDAIDSLPVDLVFLLLSPAGAGDDRLALLAAISRKLRDQEFAARLRKAPDATVLCKLLLEPQHTLRVV